MSILCSLKNINYSIGRKDLFKDLKLVLQKSDRIGLIGPNGEGKSTLMKVISGEVIPDESTPPFLFEKSGDFKDDRQIFRVHQELPIRDHAALSIKEFIYVFYPDLKELKQQLDQIHKDLTAPNLSANKMGQLLEKQNSIQDELDRKNAPEISRKYESYCKSFGLEDLDRPVGGLSGGEAQKVNLSIGLSHPAELILWDEPTNHLDWRTIETFEDELVSDKRSFILVSHDRYLLERVCSTIWYLQRGEIEVFQGRFEKFMEHQKTKDEIWRSQIERMKNRARRETDWMRQGIKARGTRNKKRVENYHELKAKITEYKNKARPQVQMNIAESLRKTKKLAQFIDVGFSFASSDKPLWSGLNFTLRKGDKIGLIGDNGVGKSTLLKMIEGRLNPTTGEVKLAENLQCLYFRQQLFDVDPKLTLNEVIGEGQETIILPNGQGKHIRSYIQDFLFAPDDLFRPLSTFSGGEKRRIQLAKLMKKQADLWIFDEPTNDLDLETIYILENKLKEHTGAFILVSHDRAFLDNTTEITWYLEKELDKPTHMEIFQGGFSQVSSYINAIDLEKEIEKNESSASNSSNIESKSSEKKLSYKEKQLLKELPGKIEKTEADLDSLKEQQANFDFTQMDHEKNETYQKLNQSISKLESELESLYEKWQDLEQ